jgi:16S rRNA processing protein RimM
LSYGIEYRIEASSVIPGFVLMKFAGIDSPEAAGSLCGKNLWVRREDAAPLAEHEYYIEDLKGLAVRTADGAVQGVIVDIIEGGGGQLAELRLVSGALRLVPFRDAFFGEIDIAAGFAVIRHTWILE